MWIAHAFGGELGELEFCGRRCWSWRSRWLVRRCSCPAWAAARRSPLFLCLTLIFGVEKEPAATAAIVVWLITFRVVLSCRIAAAVSRRLVHGRIAAHGAALSMKPRRGGTTLLMKPSAPAKPGRKRPPVKCPFCAHLDDKVVDSREARDRRSDPPPPRMPEMQSPLHHLRAHRRNSLHGHQERWPPRKIRAPETSAGPAEGLREAAGARRQARIDCGRSRSFVSEATERERTTTEIGEHIMHA